MIIQGVQALCLLVLFNWGSWIRHKTSLCLFPQADKEDLSRMLKFRGREFPRHIWNKFPSCQIWWKKFHVPLVMVEEFPLFAANTVKCGKSSTDLLVLFPYNFSTLIKALKLYSISSKIFIFLLRKKF